MKKIISLLLCIFLLFTCVSCSKPANDISEEVKTGEYLLKDGKSEYVVVKPENSTYNETVAVEEFITLFSEATGVSLPVVTDENISYSKDSRYISIGNTKLINDAGVEYSAEIKEANSIAIKTKDKSLFCIGGSEYGVNYCVYELLNRILNFEQFYADVYTLDEAVTDIDLMKYNIEEVPDITRYVGTAGFLSSTPRAALRMRAPYNYNTVFADYKNVINGNSYSIDFAHNSFDYLPPQEYYSAHPNWYMESQEQLCYTVRGAYKTAELDRRNGIPNEYNNMVDTFSNTLKEVIKFTNGSKHFYVMGDVDSYIWCSCKSCKELLVKYGTDAGGSLIFYNNVYDTIMDWFTNDEEGRKYYDPDFRMIFPAYYKTELAPVTKDSSTGEYIPIDEMVRPRDGVVIDISPRFSNYTKPFTDEVNKNDYETIKAWAAISKNTYFWVYCTNFAHYMYPLDTFNSVQANSKVYAEADCILINDQTQNGNTMGMTGWHVLKAYLSIKFSWDYDENMTELIDKFFDAMYGPGADSMKEFFYSWREYSLYQMDALKMGGSFVTRDDSVGTKKYWTKSILDKWEGLVEAAIEDIEYLKSSNPKQYEKLYRNIAMERVFLDFALTDLYKVELGSKLPKYQKNLLEGITLSKISAFNESGTTTELINSLTEAVGGLA